MKSSTRAREGRPEVDYRAIFNSAPGLFLILDPALTIVAASEAYCQATMTKLDQLAGRFLFEAFPDNPEDPSADGARNLKLSLERVLRLKRADAMAVQKYDIRNSAGNFEERYWSPLNSPVLDGEGSVRWIVHRVEDVTDLVRLKSEEKRLDQLARDQALIIERLRAAHDELDLTLKKKARLRADRDYLANIVESFGDAIIGRGIDGNILSWNRGAVAIFGYRPEEVIGKPATILSEGLRQREGFDILERLRAGDQTVTFETVRVRKDGKSFPASLTASPIVDAAGKIIGSSALIRDITEQQRSQRELKLLQAELFHLARWNTMGMTASTLAHELNQPLTAALNYIRAVRRLIADPAAAHRIPDYLDSAAEEIKLTTGIIRSLREQIDRRESERSAEDLNKIVKEAMALSSAQGPGAAVTAELLLAPALPPLVMDKVQIQQVVLNLIRNGLEAMQGVAEPSLTVQTVSEGKDFVRLSVVDVGCGIAPEVMARLFQPFVTTKASGMGIGLSICQSIIESHDGKIWAEPNTPRGTNFSIRLPVRKAS